MITAEELEKLNELKEKGVITEEEFNQKREEFLNDIDSQVAKYSDENVDIVFSIKNNIFFNINIENKSNNDIEIDWNKTSFIENQIMNGNFMYNGIAPINSNNKRPPEIIPAECSINKNIVPAINLINWENIKDLADGEIGIYLVYKINEVEKRTKLLINHKNKIEASDKFNVSEGIMIILSILAAILVVRGFIVVPGYLFECFVPASFFAFVAKSLLSICKDKEIGIIEFLFGICFGGLFALLTLLALLGVNLWRFI